MKELKNELALSENWSFIEKPNDDDFPILKNYINYTFAKAWNDRQIMLSIDGRYSVFNTGLVNRNYQYIYVLFEKKYRLKAMEVFHVLHSWNSAWRTFAGR